MKEYITLTIDDKVVQVPKGTTVYNAAKAHEIKLPIFCYQDRMPPFGACRVCLVEVDNMPKLQTSCTLECAEGMVVRTQSHPAVKARKEILEFLLINHPLDCPVCDRGGECPLQDQALSDGPGKSRFFEDKRHFEKPISLSPVLKLDRERCITCARCTRFSDIVSGDHALEFIDRGYKTEVGGTAESKFIGNTIMICPVGALTSDVYRFRARPWDNLATPSTCTLCPMGCSMYVDSRDGEIMRTRSQENPAVNDIWLCDKGWFGYEFSSSDKRLKQPLIRINGTLTPASWDDAFSYVADKLAKAKTLAAFGGNSLTVEENYLLQMLMRDVCGTNNVDHRVGMPCFSSSDEAIPAGMELELSECEHLTHAVVIGSDLTEEFPVLWLRLKQAINTGCKVLFAGNYAPEVSRYMEKVILHAPGLELQTLKSIKEFLKDSKRPALFVGSQYLATPERRAILSELVSWQHEVYGLTLNLLEGSTGSIGARFAGMHPEYRPQGIKVDKPGKSIQEVLQEASTKPWDLLYLVGADLASKMPHAMWQQVRKNLGCLIVQDLFMTKTCEDADVVLPTLSYVEKGGSFITIDGHVQKLKPAKAITKNLYADSYIFVRIAQRLGKHLVIDESFLQKLQQKRLTLVRQKRIDAIEVPPSKGLFLTFSHALFDHGIRMQHNPHLLQLAKNLPFRISTNNAFHLKDGDTVMVNNTLKGTISLDDSVAKDTLVIPIDNAYELGPNPLNASKVTTLEKI